MIGYGAMLLEGVVAVLALATVIMIKPGSDQLKMDPNLIYANGLAKYLGLMGVSFGVAFPFALLAFSTFVYDTLDVSTRLARYILQELTGWQGLLGRLLGHGHQSGRPAGVSAGGTGEGVPGRLADLRHE